ncbi:MAG: tetratricopeptide repeat protein [Candidatus Cloacimonetes bacterium]|nr:tetratricopeptide repeat protein [Candidatus Cloacimonadota bacterium]
MSLFKSDRCKICKTHRGNRFCIRIGKDICWHCCNERRVDFKCPEDCKYSLRKEENKTGLFHYKTNADSQAEFFDLIKSEINIWIRKPQQLFEGKIPIQMVETKEGREEIEKFFDQFPLEKLQSLSYLISKLKLTNLKVKPQKKNYEDIAEEFLNKIIEQDWEGTVSFLLNKKNYKNQDYKKNYIERISSNKIIKKITEYNLISSALSKDRKQALVFFEINGKYDMTVVLKAIKDSWKVSVKLFGKPEIYNGENEAIQQVAVLLSKNELTKAFELLKKYSEIYVDSADFQYYWGLYYTFNQNSTKARQFFLNAVEIDPTFIEAKYNYAFVLHSENNIDLAKNLYKEILGASPKEVKTLNNLASIYIDEQNLEEAKKLLKKCLEINKDFEVARKNLDRVNKLI